MNREPSYDILSTRDGKQYMIVVSGIDNPKGTQIMLRHLRRENPKLMFKAFVYRNQRLRGECAW